MEPSGEFKKSAKNLVFVKSKLDSSILNRKGSFNLK